MENCGTKNTVKDDRIVQHGLVRRKFILHDTRLTLISSFSQLSILSPLSYTKTLWLFICNDVNSMIIPTLTFAIVAAKAEPIFGFSGPVDLAFGHRFIEATLWSALNLLIFSLHNQMQPSAIEEDRVNKPWRPLPSKRITRHEARRLLLVSYPLLCALSLYCGGWQQSCLLAFLNLCYNEWNGGDFHCLLRNLLNAAGVACYYAGAAEIMTGSWWTAPSGFRANLLEWLSVVAAIIATTIHLQDLRDQLGDKARGRRTIPLVYGEITCRVSVAAAIALWSLLVPRVCNSKMAGQLMPVVLGGCLIMRIFLMREAKEDDRSFKLWGVWLMAVLLTPLQSS